MQLFVSEHGEAILYSVISVIIVALICLVLTSKWSGIVPSYDTAKSLDSSSFAEANKDKHPTIKADEVIYAEYGDASFDIRKYIKAIDYDGKDITEQVGTYGDVNTNQKGIYRMKCLVTNNYGISCTKFMSVIVE